MINVYIKERVNYKKLLKKALTWEIIGILVLFLLTKSLKLVLIYFIIRAILFFFHEVAWKFIR